MQTNLKLPFEEPCIELKGEIMMVNGVPLDYVNQTVRTNRFYLTQMAIDLPLQEDIDTYDQKYFNYVLVKTILRDIETAHVKVGLQILSHLPQMAQINYINLLNKFSLSKIKQVFMDEPFFLFLWEKFMNLNDRWNPDYRDLIHALQDLESPLKRVLFMVDFLPCSINIRQALIILAQDLMDQIISKSGFLLSLLRNSRSSTISETESHTHWITDEKDFLKNIIDSYQTLVLIKRSSFQVNEKWVEKTQHDDFSSLLFTKQCINIICLKFDQLFNYDRTHLMEVLTIISISKRDSLWNDIISKKYKKHKPSIHPTDTNNGSETGTSQQQTDNEASFVLLMINNFYEPSQVQWDNSLTILQALVRSNPSESQAPLIRIFLETTRHILDSSILELTALFIENMGEKAKNNKQLTLFLLELLSIINEDILESYNVYKHRQISWSKNRKRIVKYPASQCDLFVSFYQLYTVLLDTNLIDIMAEIDCKKAVENLIVLTSPCQGIVEGARRRFLQKKNAFLVQQQLHQQHSNRLDRQLNQPLFRDFSLLKPKTTNTQSFVSFLSKI